MSEEENRYPAGWSVEPVLAPWDTFPFRPGTEDRLHDLFPDITKEQINLLRLKFRLFHEHQEKAKIYILTEHEVATDMRLFVDGAMELLNRFDAMSQESRVCITNGVSLACGKKRASESLTVDIVRRLLVSLVDGIEGHELYGQWLERNRKGGRGKYPGRFGPDWDLVSGIFMSLECEILRRQPKNDDIKKTVAALLGETKAKTLSGTIQRYMRKREKAPKHSSY